MSKSIFVDFMEVGWRREDGSDRSWMIVRVRWAGRIAGCVSACKELGLWAISRWEAAVEEWEGGARRVWVWVCRVNG